MSTTKPGAYRKKKRGSTDVPVSQSLVENLNANSWRYFTGTIDGASVVVTCTGDMDILYRMGFFGKGSLSRSEANFDKCKHKVTLGVSSSSQGEGDGKMNKFIMSKRNYLLHTHYKDLSESNLHDHSILHTDSGQCSSSQEKISHLEKSRSQVHQIQSLSKCRIQSVWNQISSKQAATVFPKVPSEMFPKLTAVLELASRLNSRKHLASYVCVSKSLSELSNDVLIRLKLTQSSKGRVSGNVSGVDSVLILDSDEEESQDKEVSSDYKSSNLDLNTSNGGTDTVLTSEEIQTLKLNSVAPIEPLKTINSEVNSEEATCSTSGLSLVSDISSTGSCTHQCDIGQVPDNSVVIDQTTNDTSQESNKVPSLPLGSMDTSGEISIAKPLGSTDTSGKISISKPLGDMDTSGEISIAKPLGDTDTSGESSIAKPFGSMDTFGEISIAKPLGNTDTSGEISIAKPLGSTDRTREISKLVNISSSKFQGQFPTVEKEELKNLLCFLSQSKAKSIVVKPSTFMYITTHQAKYLSAMLSLTSVDPVMHFDYSCDTSQLPIAFTIAEQNTSFLRVYPRVEWNASTALTNRVTILNQSSMDLSGLHSVLNAMNKPSEHKSYLKVKNFVLENIVSDAKAKINHHSSSCCRCSSLRKSHLLAYLGFYKHTVEEGCEELSDNKMDDTCCLSGSKLSENHIMEESPSLRKIVFQLLTIYQSNTDNKLMEEKNILPKFHSQLSQCLVELGLCNHSEFFLLCTVLSCNQTLTSVSHEEILALHNQLTAFQFHLIQGRYIHLMNDPSLDLTVNGNSEGKDSDLVAGELVTSDDINNTPSETSKKRYLSDSENVESLESKKLKLSEENTTNTIEETMQSSLTEDTNVNLTACEESTETNCKLTCESVQSKSNLVEPNNILLESEQEGESEALSEKTPIHSLQVETSHSQRNLFQENNLVITEHICIDSSSDEEVSCPPRVHPYSVHDDDGADYLVIGNTSDEEENQHGQRKWQPCLKKDPYPVTECLQLILEEAFFLSFGLGCLCVTDADKKTLNLTQMWQRFQQLKDRFIPHYAVYHYFRSKGWVPKSGLKFGCDFILYRDGPPFYHGSYSVVVMTVKERNILPHLKNDGGHFDEHLMNWPGFSAVNRVTDHVAKNLMFCYVIWPEDDFSEEELLSPNCLKKLKVKEVVISRWVPAQDRETQFKEDIP